MYSTQKKRCVETWDTSVVTVCPQAPDCCSREEKSDGWLVNWWIEGGSYDLDGCEERWWTQRQGVWRWGHMITTSSTETGNSCTSWCLQQNPPPLTNCQSHGSAVRTAVGKKRVWRVGRWRMEDGGGDVWGGRLRATKRASRKHGEDGREEEKTNRGETDVISCRRVDDEDINPIKSPTHQRRRATWLTSPGVVASDNSSWSVGSGVCVCARLCLYIWWRLFPRNLKSE